MPDRREGLALELMQIIQTDQTATEILDDAKKKAAEIADGAQKQRDAILQEARDKRAEVERQVEAEQAEHFRRQKADIQQECDAGCAALKAKMNEHRDAWTQEILERITGG